MIDTPVAPQLFNASSIVSIPLRQLHPSPLNPRKTFDDAQLAELTASVATQGIIEPLVVRPLVQRDIDIHFEIIAGERRYRAALAAGLPEAPCLVREMSDAAVIEQALTENRQRADVHPLEEAMAIAQLQQLDPMYTVEAVARRLGMSQAWVYGRLKLLALAPAVREAYRHHAITAAHADVLARVPASLQEVALAQCFSQMLYGAALDSADPNDEMSDLPWAIQLAITAATDEGQHQLWPLLASALVSVGELKQWVAANTTVDVADQAVQEAFPEVAEALEDAEADAAKVLQLSDQFLPPVAAQALGVLPSGKWRAIDVLNEADRCEHQEDAIVVHPADRPPRRVTICRKPSCPVHRPSAPETSGPKPTRKDTAEERRQREELEEQRRKREAEAKAWEADRPEYQRALGAAVKKLSLTADLVKKLVPSYRIKEIETEFGVRLTGVTARDVLLLAATEAVIDNWYTQEGIEALGKAAGLSVAAWRKARAKATPSRAKAKDSKTLAAKKPGARGGSRCVVRGGSHAGRADAGQRA